MFKKYRNLWLALGALIILCPLGLIVSGVAFGEWGVNQLGEEVGFVPAGMARMADLWQYAPLSDYRIAGFDASFMQAAAGYILSALVGVALVAGIMSLLRKVVKE